MMPIDCVKGTCQGMADMALCHVQEVMVESAMEKKTSPALVAKLCMGLANKFAAIRKDLGTSLKNKFHHLDPNWNYFLKGKTDVYLGLARSYQGKEAEDKGEHGASMALFGHAAIIWSRALIPKTANRALEDLRMGLERWIHVNSEFYNQAKKDNDTVYFMPVPKIEDLPEPPPMFAAKPLPLDDASPSALTGPFLAQNAATTPAPANLSLSSLSLSPTPSSAPTAQHPPGPCVFACGYCTSHFQANVLHNARVECPVCAMENMIS